MKYLLLLFGLVVGCSTQHIVQSPMDLYVPPLKKVEVVVETKQSFNVDWQIVVPYPWIESVPISNQSTKYFMSEQEIEVISSIQDNKIILECSNGITTTLTCSQQQGQLDISCGQIHLGAFCTIQE